MQKVRKQYDPARTILDRLGGPSRVHAWLAENHKLVGLKRKPSSATIYRWTWSAEHGGCDGYIPRWNWPVLIAMAREVNVDLTEDDFRRIPASRESDNVPV